MARPEGFSRLILRISSRMSFGNRSPTELTVTELSGLEQAEAFPVPCGHRLRLDNDDGASPIGPVARQPGPEDPIGVA